MGITISYVKTRSLDNPTAPTIHFMPQSPQASALLAMYSGLPPRPGSAAYRTKVAMHRGVGSAAFRDAQALLLLVDCLFQPAIAAFHSTSPVVIGAMGACHMHCRSCSFRSRNGTRRTAGGTMNVNLYHFTFLPVSTHSPTITTLSNAYGTPHSLFVIRVAAFPEFVRIAL
jgi:hypothetical protein